MESKHCERLAAAAAALAFGRRRFGELDHRRVHPRLEHLRSRTQPGIFAVMDKIGTIAPDRRADRTARFGMRADELRQ